MKIVLCFNSFKVSITVPNNKNNNCMIPLNWKGYLISLQPQSAGRFSSFFVYVFHISKNNFF